MTHLTEKVFDLVATHSVAVVATRCNLSPKTVRAIANGYRGGSMASAETICEAYPDKDDHRIFREITANHSERMRTGWARKKKKAISELIFGAEHWHTPHPQENGWWATP